MILEEIVSKVKVVKIFKKYILTGPNVFFWPRSFDFITDTRFLM